MPLLAEPNPFPADLDRRPVFAMVDRLAPGQRLGVSVEEDEIRVFPMPEEGAAVDHRSAAQRIEAVGIGSILVGGDSAAHRGGVGIRFIQLFILGRNGIADQNQWTAAPLGSHGSPLGPLLGPGVEAAERRVVQAITVGVAGAVQKSRIRCRQNDAVYRLRRTLEQFRPRVSILFEQDIPDRVVIRRSPVPPHGKHPVRIVVGVERGGRPELLQVADAAGRLPPVPRPVQRRQKQRRQNRNDGDHHQKFNQSKTISFHYRPFPVPGWRLDIRALLNPFLDYN